VRTLIATVFNYSLDGLLADEGTEFWRFCFDLPENREPDAYAHVRPDPERRAQDRLLPDPEDGRLGQHHDRRW
jgi:hypothetical protein